MRRVTCLIWGLWIFGAVAASWVWERPLGAIGIMALALVAAGFSWSGRGVWGLVLLTLLAIFGSGAFRRAPAEALSVVAVLPLLALFLREKGNEYRCQYDEWEQAQQDLTKRLDTLQEEHQRLHRQIRNLQETIEKITDQYGLSKRFLATLDLRQALEIVEEALTRWLPQLESSQRKEYLESIQRMLKTTEVSAQTLMELLPDSAKDPTSRERWAVLSGQLALGLRRSSLYRQVEESAMVDGLTGLLARRHCRQRLQEELDRASRRRSSLAVLMVDIDDFKKINDTCGHLVGDLVLREVAYRIQRSVREVDLVGRYGGEEFALVLPEASRKLGVQIADRIRSAISATPIVAYDERVTVTVSIGVAVGESDQTQAEELLEAADQAMYRAKAMGRNRTVASHEI